MRNFLFLFFFPLIGFNQISGVVQSGGVPLSEVSIWVLKYEIGTTTNEKGWFTLPEKVQEKDLVVFSKLGYLPETTRLDKRAKRKQWIVTLKPDILLDEVIITGHMRPIQKSESILPVEVYSAEFLKQNPSPSIFESLQLVNGVRPQINCSVCNTGDIQINGLEGGYTLILIDGMPVVSSLASVYGLNGIPNAIIERVEITRGPAGTIYGSQAMGGIINIITKQPDYSPKVFFDTQTTSWLESNLDFGYLTKLGEKSNILTSVNAFLFDEKYDFNNDNFTDLTLQKRVSLFNKLQWKNDSNQSANMVMRYVYEDRWGGEMSWNPTFRGGDQVYGESIYTNRFEFLGNQPINNLKLQYSLVYHHQDAAYGKTPFKGKEWISFSQLTWLHKTNRNNLMGGLALRYSWYDDNTPATTRALANYPDQSWIPGLFVENEYKITNKHTLLGGLRYDQHSIHGPIFTPRLGMRILFGNYGKFRLIYGKGFRVINIFTEDHAALIGSRKLVLDEQLSPETSANVTINYSHQQTLINGWNVIFDTAFWYTRFKNQILPDYDTNSNEIRYANLKGKGVSQGANFNIQWFNQILDFRVGMTFLDNFIENESQRKQPILTESWSGTWAAKYRFQQQNITLDYTGSIYGPIRLPLLSTIDPRPEYSPIWNIQNIKITYLFSSKIEGYLGVKNLFNWTPAKDVPFLIARAQDPFDKNVVFDAQGNPTSSPENPYALNFDPSYMYATNQGIRAFIGVRYALF